MIFGPAGKTVSAIVFTMGLLLSITTSENFWQALVAGALFGIWALLLCSEDEK